MSRPAPTPYERLDARLKLFQLGAVGVCAFATRAVESQLALLAFVVGIGLLAGQRRTVVRFAFVAVPLAALVLWQRGSSSMFVNFLHFGAFVVLKFASPVLLLLFLARNEELSTIVQALERLRVPRQITLPLTVAIRFVPSLQHEYASIRDAMRLRDVHPTFFRFWTEPVRTVELVLVPMLMRSLKISDELSASALTRGIEASGRTAYRPLRWRMSDTIAAILTIAAIAAVAATEALLT